LASWVATVPADASPRDYYRVTKSTKKNSPGRTQWLVFMRHQLEQLDINRYASASL
jgi:hypothetical protein